MARPARYSKGLAECVLAQLRLGRPLRAVCAGQGMPSARTVQAWVNGDLDGFAGAYRAARAKDSPRPGAYAPDIAAKILDGLRAGRNPIDICRDPGMPPYAALRDWVRRDRHGFAAPYREALRAGGTRSARPTQYSEHIAQYIFDELCAGRALEAICAEPEMPTAAAVRRWVAQDRKGFAAHYHTARWFGCDTLAGEMLSIVDDRSGALMPVIRDDGDIDCVLDPDRVRRAELRCRVRRLQLSRRLRDLGRDFL